MNSALEQSLPQAGRVWLLSGWADISTAVIHAALEQARWQGAALSTRLVVEARAQAGVRLGCSPEIVRLGGRARPLDAGTLEQSWQRQQARLLQRLGQAAEAAGVPLDLQPIQAPGGDPAANWLRDLLPLTGRDVLVLPRPADQPTTGGSFRLSRQLLGDSVGAVRCLLWIPGRGRRPTPGRVVAVGRGIGGGTTPSWVALARELAERRRQALTLLTLAAPPVGQPGGPPGTRWRSLRDAGGARLLAHLQAEGATELILERALAELAPQLLDAALERLAIPVTVLD